MKKLKFVLLIIGIMTIINVKASNSFDLVCNTPKMFKDGYTNCDVMLSYDSPVSLVEFNYDSEMNVSFTEGEETLLSVNDNKVTLKYKNAITPNNIKILNVKLINNDGKLGDKKILLKNIRVTSNDVSYSLDNQEKMISIITEEELSNNCNLSSLTVDGVSVPNFSPTKYKYNGIVSNKRIVFLDAKRSDERSSATGLGNALLTENVEKDISVIVTVENGERCTYSLGITYVKENQNITVEKNSNNNLDNVELFNQDEKINFTFDNKKTSFDITVDNNVTDLTIKAILQEEKSSFVSKFGPRDVKLEEGKNSFQIKVQAENGEIKTYSLNITRDKVLSGDTTLKSLMVNDIDVILKPNEFNYEIEVPSEYHMTDIKAIANDEKAKVTFENIEIKENEDNVVVIKVEAPNKDFSEYVITISQNTLKADVVEEVKFEKIVVSGYNLDFDINKNQYNLKIGSDVQELNISVLPNNIDYTVLNNTHLKNGSVITVKVVDGNIERTYEIKIEKDATMKTNVLCYLFFIIAVIILLVSIRFWVKNRDLH